MPMIRECIVTTLNEEGRVHIAPLGLIAEEGGWIIAPFRPSATLDNLRATPHAVANFIDDVLDLRRLPHRPEGLADAALDPCARRRAGRRALPCRADRRPCRGGRAAAALPLPRRPRGDPRAVQGLQPRASRGDRGRHPREPAAHAAAREDRARAWLSADRGGEDRRPARARGLAAARREDRGPLQARAAPRY